MNSAKVIGKTNSDFMHPSLEGKDIKILQIINAETGELEGRPFFATDPIGVSIDEIVAFETSFQATWPRGSRTCQADSRESPRAMAWSIR